MSWDEGYVSQIGYVRGYHRELNPLMLDLALLANGYRPPQRSRLRYLELGFGQGVSLNIHAAACEGAFWGNDFNPSHTANANNMAQASGAELTVLDDSFAELAARTDLPEFDIIVLHGVWSWVSDKNRRLILDIIHSKLALGGILYFSYNTTPGWSAIIPVRDLMMLHFNHASEPGSHVTHKIDEAVKFMQRLIDAGAAYTNNVPSATPYIGLIKNQRRDYVAHELFNADWAPMPFAQVMDLLTALNLSFVGDAAIINIFADNFLPEKIKAFLLGIKNPLFYQSARDYCISTQMFRKDIWIRGGSKLSKLEQLQLMADKRFVLVSDTDHETLSIPCSIGSITADKKAALPIIAALERNNFAPKSINELLSYPELGNYNLAQVCEIILTLCGRYVEPAHDEETVSRLTPRTEKLNRYLTQNVQSPSEHNIVLASPVTGGAITITLIDQLLLSAVKDGCDSPERATDFVWGALAAEGRTMNKPDGTPCNGESENKARVLEFALPFFDKRMHLLHALKVV
jgi:hypothetical protein